MEGFKAVLENLYLRLIYSNEFGSRKTFHEVNLGDVVCISKTLFEQLSKRLHVPLDCSSANQYLGGEMQQSKSNAAEDEIVMLLRCCIASMNFLEYDHSVLMERCEFLRMILCMLLSCQKDDSSKGCKFSSTLNPDTHLRLVCRLLEVFMDELITNKGLSKHIQFAAFPSPGRENMCSFSESGYALKVVSAHFLHSYTGAQPFRGLVENLIWPCKENRATPEVSLTAAVSLLVNPALASPPAFLHAHLISLISDVIGKAALYASTCSKLRFISCHMPAFEKSVSLYRRQLAKLVHNLFTENDDSVIKSATRGVGRQRPSESYFGPTLNEQLVSTIRSIDVDCSSCMMMSRTNSDMVEMLKSYAKENLHLLDESCRRIVSVFLSSFLEKAISADESKDDLLKINGNVVPEDIFFLASILKLMSCSLLQTVLYISSVRNSVQCKTSSAESYLFKEYELLARIIDSFGQYRIRLPVQKLLHNQLEAQLPTVKGAKLMFVHFTGLLSVFLANGIEILAKGCLYLMLNVMNLLFFEEGSLNFLSQLASPGAESSFAQHSPANISVCVEYSGSIQEGLKNRCSARLASNFKKIQMSCTRRRPAAISQDEDSGNISEEEEACNGVAFLKCLSKNSGASDLCLEDDLVDFIQCKPGKDYSSWLKNRTRFKTWRLEKTEVKSWEMKRAIWKSLSRKRKPRKDHDSEKPVKKRRR